MWLVGNDLPVLNSGTNAKPSLGCNGVNSTLCKSSKMLLAARQRLSAAFSPPSFLKTFLPSPSRPTILQETETGHSTLLKCKTLKNRYQPIPRSLPSQRRNLLSNPRPNHTPRRIRCRCPDSPRRHRWYSNL